MPDILVAQGLTALREAAYNTDAGLATTNGLEFIEATCRIVDTYDGGRGDVRHGTGGTLPPTRSAGRFGEIRLRGEMKGPGVAYTDPLTQLPLYHVLLGCAYSGSVGGGAVALSGVRPDLSGSFTLGFYSAATFYRFTGMRGSMRFRANAAERGFWEFTGAGVLAASHPISQSLPAITYPNQTVTPPVYVGDSPSFQGWTPVVGGYDISVDNTRANRLDGGATDGHAGFVLTNRAVTWAFPGETVAPASFNPYATSLSGTVGSLAITHGKNVTGKSWAFSASKASNRPPELADESGRLIWNLGGGCHITSGNDELVLTVS